MTKKDETLAQKVLVFGRIVCKYKVPQEFVDDINQKYEDALENTNLLTSHGKNLAGRLDSELNILPIIQTSRIFKFITQCMSDYINTCVEHGTVSPGPHNLDILSCWMNDMKPGEYNPVHTHNENLGYSANLYLKIPEFINDVTEPHKFKDGRITFIGPDARGCESYMPEPGDFYVFQADHMHCVYPFKTKDPNAIRRSMPINFIINNSVRGEEIKNV